jgi:phosphatidylglycerol---prolipoprotein diacylglyceryl transferase
MYREIAHIYGPISIHSFGVMIAVGIFAFILLMQRHPRFKTLLTIDQFHTTLCYGIIAGVVGGRLLYTVSSWDLMESPFEIFEIWHGGFSIMGAILGIVLILPWYLHNEHIPVLPFFDLAALNAPIIQAFARIGCFLAGCCYGMPSALPWAVTFTDPSSPAPCFVPLHPTQLYSSLAAFSYFLLMYYILQYKLTKPGQLLGAYFIFAGFDRFFIDFWRADRIYLSASWSTVLSMHQWISIGICALGFCIIGISSYYFSSNRKS